MRTIIMNYWSNHPLRSILFLSLVLRLIAVIFSKGYGMHDDHYLVIEAAQSWIDGYDYNDWLPENSRDGKPTGHSFFYVGLHFVLFKILEFIGVFQPEVKMFIVRLVHALLSLITVFYAYRITARTSNDENAKIVASLLGLLWLFPILSVRNMVEMVCVPFAMMSFWYLIQRRGLRDFVLAGILIGLSIAVRLQVYLIWGGVGLFLLFRREIKEAIVFGVVSVSTLFLTQITDLFLWGKPFAEITQYIFYNSTHYDDYVAQGFFQYFLVVVGLLIPPVSLYLLFGYFRSWKKYGIIFLPSVIFLLFHSFYPNKQERFILPILPFIIMLGVVGWREFYEKSAFWSKRAGLYKYSIRFFWTLNILALLLVSPAYSKRSRVEVMKLLDKESGAAGLLLERSTKYGCYLLPRFYNGMWESPHYCYDKEKADKLSKIELSEILESRNVSHVLFIEADQLSERRANLGDVAKLEFVEEVKPSYLDQLLHFLNPRNQNETVYVYRIIN